jgi:hypothetical protein
MSLPVATTINGMDSLEVLHQNLRVARGFTAMTPEEMEALRQRCAPFAADGHLELFKSTKSYEGAVGREQHGYVTQVALMSLADPVRGFLEYTAMLTAAESTMRATGHCRTVNAAVRGRAVV